MKLATAALLLAGGGMLIPGAPAPGQPLPSSADSTKIYPLAEVVTTGSRIEILRRTAPSAVSLIARDDLAVRAGTLLSQFLTGVPGLFVRPYGGGSALQTISLRGMSPENTLVLVDGQRINSPQNGQADFGFLSASDVERVEIARGGYSPLYGTDAVGGVINVITRRPGEQLGASVSQTFGSYGYQGSRASLQGTEGSFGWRTDIQSEQGRGNYRYFFQDAHNETELNRNGNDFRLLTFNGRAELELGEGARVFFLSSYVDGDRGAASPVSDPSVVSRARLADRTFRTSAGGEFRPLPDVSVKISGSYYADDQHYTDPHLLVNGSILQSDGKSRAATVTPEIQYTGFGGSTVVLGAELGKSWFTGTDLHSANRTQYGLYLTDASTLKTDVRFPFEVAFFPAVRYDHYSDVEAGLSPRIGMNIGLWKEPLLRIRSSYGSSFRIPTFNDLYWIAGGNPSLRPERSNSFDLGALAEHEWNGYWFLDLSYFSIQSKDRILWSPTSGTFWSPRNISEVRSRGVELEGRWEGFSRMLSVTITSSWTKVTKASEDFPGDPTKDKQLVYIPRQTISASVALHLGNLQLSMQHAWTSYRYTTEMNDRFLPSFGVTDASLRYAVPIGGARGFVKLEATNIFGTRYQVITLYPMPLQEARVTVGGEL